MKKINTFAFILIAFTIFNIISCRDWFGEDTQPSTITGIAIEPLAGIEITTPEYGSLWNPGDTMLIKWRTENLLEKVDTELYRKTNFQFYLTKDKLNTNSFLWVIPEAINHSVHYKLKITNADNESDFTLSRSFAIRE